MRIEGPGALESRAWSNEDGSWVAHMTRHVDRRGEVRMLRTSGTVRGDEGGWL